MASEAAKDVIAGTVGGAAQILCGHPLDTIKVKLQTQISLNGHSGAMDALRRTVAQDGIAGLYRGMAAPLATVAAMNAVLFTARGQIEVLFTLFRGSSVPLSASDQMICGAGAGAVMSLVACPTELIKCRLQAAETKSKLMGPFDVAHQVLRKERGFVGLFRGLNATFCREVPGNAIMFGIYHSLKGWMEDRIPLDQRRRRRVALLMAGGMAGVVPCVLIYPVDVVKSVIQVDRFHHPKYSGTVDAFRKIFVSQGLKGFYKGFCPALIRSVPATAACFLAYELTKASFT